MFKKIPALLLSAAILATSSVTAFAETPQTQTAVVSQTLGASSVEWNGKTALAAGKSYVVSKNITVSKSVTIPAKTTLTIKSGAKLQIGAKGKLLVKGTLKLQKKSTLAVSGALNLYKGKVLNSSGEVRFGSKSTVTLSGKFTSTQYGSVTGEPKKLTIGDSAVIKISGKNSSKKLAAALDSSSLTAADEKAIKELMTQVLEGVLVKGETAKVYNAAFPTAVLDKVKKEYEDSVKKLLEEEGSLPDGVPASFDEYLDYMGEFIIELYGYILGGKIVSIEVTDFSVKAVDVSSVTLPAEYKGTEKVAAAQMKYVITADNGITEDIDTSEALFAKINGKWYIAEEETDYWSDNDYGFI